MNPFEAFRSYSARSVSCRWIVSWRDAMWCCNGSYRVTKPSSKKKASNSSGWLSKGHCPGPIPPPSKPSRGSILPSKIWKICV